MLIAAESIFPPIPSELVLLLAGFSSDQGRFSFAEVLLMATLGSLIGAWVLYGVGWVVGEDRIESFAARVGKPLGFSYRDIDRANELFKRRGTPVVFGARLVPLVRSLVSLPAGWNRMPLLKFSLLTAVGSAIWNAVWIGIGRALGSRWEKAERWAGFFDYLVYACILGLIVWIIVRKVRMRGRIDGAA